MSLMRSTPGISCRSRLLGYFEPTTSEMMTAGTRVFVGVMGGLVISFEKLLILLHVQEVIVWELLTKCLPTGYLTVLKLKKLVWVSISLIEYLI